MKRVVETFKDRYPLIGPIIWILSIQYFLIQYVVALTWRSPYAYNLFNNTISDLGNTTCGVYNHRSVCSPWHDLMNASFIVLGLFIISGSTLIYREFKSGSFSRLGFSAMGIAGLGSIMVGLFPENSISWLHESGAIMSFLVGNFSLLILGVSLSVPRSLQIYTFISGLVALIALAFLIGKHYLGLGNGGMERLTSYPQILWLIVFGLYMSRNHFMKLKAHSSLIM